jgi:hypothetical protein
MDVAAIGMAAAPAIRARRDVRVVGIASPTRDYLVRSAEGGAIAEHKFKIGERVYFHSPVGAPDLSLRFQ